MYCIKGRSHDEINFFERVKTMSNFSTDEAVGDPRVLLTQCRKDNEVLLKRNEYLQKELEAALEKVSTDGNCQKIAVLEREISEISTALLNSTFRERELETRVLELEGDKGELSSEKNSLVVANGLLSRKETKLKQDLSDERLISAKLEEKNRFSDYTTYFALVFSVVVCLYFAYSRDKLSARVESSETAYIVAAGKAKAKEEDLEKLKALFETKRAQFTLDVKKHLEEVDHNKFLVEAGKTELDLKETQYALQVELARRYEGELSAREKAVGEKKLEALLECFFSPTNLKLRVVGSIYGGAHLYPAGEERVFIRNVMGVVAELINVHTKGEELSPRRALFFYGEEGGQDGLLSTALNMAFGREGITSLCKRFGVSSLSVTLSHQRLPAETVLIKLVLTKEGFTETRSDISKGG